MTEALQPHAPFLWGLCYRMTGVAADADELVQETFVRALASPPSGDAPVRPWLTRVAMNLARDRLRQRKREGYVGPWLPSPVEAPELAAPPTSARYEQLESVGVAFLLTLEALTPNQRAVLLLRDVFGDSVAQTAQALALTESNVKTTLHRARAAMAGYDASRSPITPQLQERTRAALEAFFGALASGETEPFTELLRSDVREYNDGAGQYSAARVVLEGADRVILFSRRLLQIRGMPASVEVRLLNGLPAFVTTFARSAHAEPPRAVISCSLDPSGKIAALYTVVADAKLTHVRF